MTQKTPCGEAAHRNSSAPLILPHDAAPALKPSEGIHLSPATLPTEAASPLSGHCGQPIRGRVCKIAAMDKIHKLFP